MEKSRMYQLYELRDDIKMSLLNVKMLIEDQKELSATLIECGKEKRFENLLKGLPEEWKNYEHQYLVLNTRLEKVNELISRYEKQDENSKLVEEIVSLTLEALGAVKSENKK